MKSIIAKSGVVLLLLTMSACTKVSDEEVMEAIQQGNTTSMKELLDKGVDPSSRIAGYTILDIAINLEQTEVASLLLDNGADVNKRNSNGRAPLHEVARQGNVEIAKALIQKGADLKVKGHDGRTPVDRAIYCVGGRLSGATGYHRLDKCKKVLWLLLEKGADVNSQSKNGDTALHRAIGYGNIDVVKKLLQHGANPTIKNKEGLTPLGAARKTDYPDDASLKEIVRLLEERQEHNETTPPADTPSSPRQNPR